MRLSCGSDCDVQKLYYTLGREGGLESGGIVSIVYGTWPARAASIAR
jgi:hypothetical protein